MKRQRPEPELEAKLEILDDDVEDVSHNRATLKLTPAEIAEREAEKQGLAAELQARVATRDGALGVFDDGDDGTFEHLDPRAKRAGSTRREQPVAAESIAQPTIPVPSSPALEAASEAVEEADAALAELEQERKSIERDRAEARKTEEAAHQAKLDELRRRRNAAEAEVKRQRLAHAAVELKAQIEAAERERERESQRKDADVAEKNAQLTARVKPVLDRARGTYSALQRLQREHGEHLEKLATMSWDLTPSTWPGGVRVAWNNEVHDPAVKFRGELDLMLVGLGQNIRNAVVLLSRGWIADASFPQEVNEVIRLLSYSDEYVRVADDGLADLHRRLADIFDRASFDHRTIPDVIGTMPRPLREAATAEALAEIAEQERAEGI